MALWWTVLIVLGSVIVGCLLFVLAGRRSPEGSLSHLFPANIATLTTGAVTFLIAITISAAFTGYKAAQTAAQEEATAVLAMSRAAMFMEPALRDELRNELACYAQAVIDVEWPSMQDGQTRATEAVSNTIVATDLLLVKDPSRAQEGLSVWEAANEQRSSARVARLLEAGTAIPPLLWALLIIGSLISVGSLLVFADRSKPGWAHVVLVLGPLFVSVAALVVIAFFDKPYGDSPGAIAPSAMHDTLVAMTAQERGDGLPPARCTDPAFASGSSADQ